VTRYAIGDVQGCNDELQALIARLHFSADRDQIYFVGDLVNRGPASLHVLRFVRSLGDNAVVVLGNHDLHLLAVAYGVRRNRKSDTLDDVLTAPDRDALLDWLITRPMAHIHTHRDGRADLIVHAGLVPQWTVGMTLALAREVESALRADPSRVFDHMYGDEPDKWDNGLVGAERLRFIVNCFTRLRYVDGAGRLALRVKGHPRKVQAKSLVPWFEAANARWHGPRVVFGHWSTLGFFTNSNVVSLDTGCVWGGSLTALRLDTPNAKPIQVACRALREP